MIMQRTGRRTAIAVIALSVVTAGAARSDDKAAAATGEPETSGRTTDAPAECEAAPLKFSSIFSLSGPSAEVYLGIEQSIRAAEAAINTDCQLGRPIEIEICDDKSDPNEAAACGRQAREDGAVAIVARAGSFDEGVSTAALPVFADGGGSGYTVTSPVAFSAEGSLTYSYGMSNVAKAAGASDLLFVAADIPTLQFVGSLAADGAEAGDVAFGSVFFPPDTTDYTTVAAQIASQQPSAINFASLQPEPLLKALDAEGITANNTVMISSVPLGEDTIAQLGGLAEGLYQTAGAWPYADTTNVGIAQMHAEFEAAELDDEEVTGLGVSSWSLVHALADALSPLTAAELDSLSADPQMFVDAIVAASPYERTELAPYDLSALAWTAEENAALAQIRSFSRFGLVTRTVDGASVVVTDGYVDFSAPFELLG